MTIYDEILTASESSKQGKQNEGDIPNVSHSQR